MTVEHGEGPVLRSFVHGRVREGLRRGWTRAAGEDLALLDAFDVHQILGLEPRAVDALRCRDPETAVRSGAFQSAAAGAISTAAGAFSRAAAGAFSRTAVGAFSRAAAGAASAVVRDAQAQVAEGEAAVALRIAPDPAARASTPMDPGERCDRRRCARRPELPPEAYDAFRRIPAVGGPSVDDRSSCSAREAPMGAPPFARPVLGSIDEVHGTPQRLQSDVFSVLLRERAVRLNPLTPTIGAEVVGLDPSGDIDAAEQCALERALAEHGVLVFRDCALTAAQQERFARRFGTPMTHPAYETVPGAPSVTILESTAEAPSLIERWHTDMTFSARPPKITMLHAQVLPPTGGDTLFASSTAAFDALSPALREFLGTLTAVHDFSFGFRESLAEPGGAERLAPAIAANPPVEHPVVVTHPVTGRRGLYVNGLFTVRIRGMTAAESSALLAFLYAHQVEPEFTVRLRWAPGTLAIWDNRCTQHKPVNDYFPAHRRMHRVTIEGEAPAAA